MRWQRSIHPRPPQKGHMVSSQGASGQYLYDRSGPTPPFSIRLNLGSGCRWAAWTMGVDGWSKRFMTQMLEHGHITLRAPAGSLGRAINASSPPAKCASDTGLDIGDHGPTPRVRSVETATFTLARF